MIDYDSKRAEPLSSYTFSIITSTLSQWRDTLREELECLIYVKNSIAQNQLTQSDKVSQVIPKMEALCLKQIECINEFISEINNDSDEYQENSEKVYSKVESIRDNYNKIIVNLKKMITSVPELVTYINKYKSTAMREVKSLTVTNNDNDNDDVNLEDNLAKDLLSLTEKPKQKTISKRDEETISINAKTLSTNSHNRTRRNIKQPKQGNTKTISDKYNKSYLDKLYTDINSISKKANTINTSKHSRQNSKSKSSNNTQTNFRKSSMNSNRYTSTSKSPNKDIIYQKFNDELKHIRSYCETIERELKNHCLLSNERKEFENIKKENIKLIADVGILKEDMIDIMKKYQQLSERMVKLEGENEQLRLQNKKLIAFISMMNNNNNRSMVNNSNNELVFSNNTNNEQFSQIKSINNNIDNLNRMMNEQITEMSAFNNNTNSNNDISIKSNVTPPPNNNISNITSNIGNLSALTQMNQTIASKYRTVTPVKSRRYLIPKNE